MTVHPGLVRLTHWINAAAMTVMVMSGWEIHNAAPIAPFAFPSAITLGGGLPGALQWHFAAMWVLVVNGGLYLLHGAVTGRLVRKLLPVSLQAAFVDGLTALRGRLRHDDLAEYNGVQRLLYAGVILLGLAAVASGLAIWKPVQFGWLTALLGDFDSARIVHFVAMAGIVAFAAIHMPMALLFPRSLRAMILGR